MDFDLGLPSSHAEELSRLKEVWRDFERKPIEHVLASTAGEVCSRLQVVFDAFISTLRPDEELGLALTSFGNAREISVETVTALGPNLLQIDGYENEQRVTLVQHISQLSFLLIPLKAQPPEAPRRAIGFDYSCSFTLIQSSESSFRSTSLS